MTKFNIGDRVEIKSDYYFKDLQRKKGTIKRIMDNEGMCENLYLLDLDEPIIGGDTYSVTKPQCGKIMLEEFLTNDEPSS